MPKYSAIVAGTRFYNLTAIRTLCAPGTHLVLQRQPANPHDSNAVAVLLPGRLFGMTMLGHLKAGLAKRIAPKLDAGANATVTVSSTYAPEDSEYARLSIAIVLD